MVEKGTSQAHLSESVVEQAALAWFEALDWSVAYSDAAIATGEPVAERGVYRETILAGRLREALALLNPSLPPDAFDEAFRKLTSQDAPTLIERNRALYRMLVNGVTVDYRHEDGLIGGIPVRVLDFDAPDNNDWMAVN